MGEVLPFYKDPTIVEAGTILFRILSLVFAIWFYRVLRSIPGEDNVLDPTHGMTSVSPFLIVENERGDLAFSRKKFKGFYKIMAALLILIFTVVPLVTICSDLGWFYAFYY